MKRIKKFIKYLVLIMTSLLLLALVFPTWTSSIEDMNSISTLEQVEINGSDHEIMIRGHNKNNPVIIFVHGGPGRSEIPYAKKYQDLLETEFTVVNYDQRASGKSYHFFEDYSNLSSDLLVEDLLALTDYIANHLDKEKIILIGHSYGTYIATQAAAKAPDKYEAYVGIGQMSNTVESEMDSLHFTIKQAQLKSNTEDVAHLQRLMEEISSGKTFTPRHLVSKYGGATRLITNPDGNMLGMLFSTEYNLLDIIRYSKGISLSQEVLVNEVLQSPLPAKVNSLTLPFYFVMGDYDYQTSSNSAKKYFDQIIAKKKEFIAYEQSAHYPQFEEKERFFEWMRTTFKK
ncbi:alpha/beta hydrolase [Lysinibacillus sp. YS11]|uniref:Alpha/beta hydrolase n=1 Tax=Lysinibacillus capsici TaxID=2115968 RepID=A0ABY8KBX3_9BACI|nr:MULTISPECIES: alpha/beta hydrolase [Lysinibacillus]AUS88902.1 alpha/beta hydrolase [Lysinibacillus sp. YS11]MDP1395707.1 alpha/beta hydrolase [Lysinibacillus capsici]MDP1416170.1 alpha/beta hydrolase [Lysinibacillus capsici]MDP1432069.1 alpha/beta hydrolase [Lysinibacillus capsici]WGF37014.1 alpha/beta hydrolase [Lysinibacillus capsici]